MSVLSVESLERVKELIVSEGFLTKDQLDRYVKEARELQKPLITYLVESKFIGDEDLTRIIAHSQNIPYVNLSKAVINPQVLNLLEREIAQRYMAVPLGEAKDHLAVAMLDAANVQAVDYLANKIGRPLAVYLASESGLRQVLSQYGKAINQSVEEELHPEDYATDEEGEEPDAIKAIVEDSPITKALNAILEYAVKNRASDVHVEPLKDNLKIRTRIDGVLREIMRLPKSSEAPLISRIKILSNLKIDEHRIPQDGQFAVRVGDHEIDLRIAISPVVWGEQVVIRLLDRGSTTMRLEQLGLIGPALQAIRRGLSRPNGMIINSGPTGSGKTTTLYAMVEEIKNDAINIVTLEDPVEYKIEGVNQIQINPDVGLTFATGLRSILRQDPDVVMVGEIRDKETAELAVQSALTGHIVLSTLHTNSAAGVLPRLLNMGIEPFLIASTVNTIIGQRLVRRIVEDKEAYSSSKVEALAVNETLGSLLPENDAEVTAKADHLGYKRLPLRNQSAYTLFKGKDRRDSPGGYRGRMGLFETIDVNDQIEEMIMNHSPSGAIMKKAMAQGTITMRQDGYLKALDGLTSIDEVNRVAALGSA